MLGLLSRTEVFRRTQPDPTFARPVVPTMIDRRLLIVLPGCVAAFLAGLYLFSQISGSDAAPPAPVPPAVGRPTAAPGPSEPEANRPRRGDGTGLKDGGST